jgi:DNA-binding NarL/FixJ family response regulator
VERVIDVVVVYGDSAVRAELLKRLRAHAEIALAGVANGVENGMAAVTRMRPDVVILERGLNGDGLALCERVRALWDPPGVVVWAEDGVESEAEALRSGAAAVISGSATQEEIVRALRRAHGSAVRSGGGTRPHTQRGERSAPGG